MTTFQPATLCYLQTRSQVLMLHRVKKIGDVHKGKWNGLGGKFNPGESAEECVIREFREESGLTLISPKLRGIIMFPRFTPGKDWLVFLFTAHRFKGKLMKSSEGDLAWIPRRKLTSLPMWKGDRIFLNWLRRKAFFSAKFIYRNKKFIRHQVQFYRSTI